MPVRLGVTRLATLCLLSSIMLTFNLSFENNYLGIRPTQAQKKAIAAAVNEFGRNFQHDATIDLTVDLTDGLYTLAGALTKRIEQKGNKANFGSTEVVRNKIIRGEDLNGDESDGLIVVNWGRNWSIESHRKPNRYEYDLYSTIYHELTHLLGFASALRPTGLNGTFRGVDEVDNWSKFDQFLTDDRGERLINKKGSVNIEAVERSLTGGSSAEGNGLFFNGKHAVAANGGEPVGLFSPRWYRPGSSVSHLDEDHPELSDSLMSPYLDSGAAAPRHLSRIERGILLDLGYSLASPFALSESETVDVTNALGLDTLSLQLESSSLQAASDIFIFAIDESGAQQQISQFSVIDSTELPGAYQPVFTLDLEQTAVEALKFELVGDSGSRWAAPTILKDGTVSLDFGKASLNLSQAIALPHTQRLTETAAAIDLQNYGSAVLNFSVYREAGLDSIVGFYQTDSADGAIVTDTLTGTRLMPGDEGYQEAALSRQVGSLLSGENGKTRSFSSRNYGSRFLSAFIAVDAVLGNSVLLSEVDLSDANLYFSHAQANRGEHNHIKLLGDNTFGFEDSVELGDRDYNDMIVKFSVV